MAKLPRYLEAYPALSASDVMGAIATKRTQGIWRDEAGKMALRALLSEERPGAASIIWSLVSGRLDYITDRGGDATLTTATSRVGDNRRHLLLCPGCAGQATRLLLAEGGWACRACHGFRYASQLEGAIALRDGSRADLRSAVRRGKPHGQWNKTRRGAVDTLHNADRGDADASVVPRWTHQVHCAEWFRRDERPSDLGEEDAVHERDAFAYWEAYPRIEASGARRGLNSGTPLCLWYGGTPLRNIGGAEAAEEGTDLKVRYSLQRTACHEGAEGSFSFRIMPTGSAQNNKRWLLRCPSCSAARSAVALVRSQWACRTCHGLEYRSALVGTAVRRAEKVAQLQAELDQLVASGARRSRIERHKHKLEDAKRAAGEGPYPTVSRKYVYLVESAWQTGTFSPAGFYDGPLEARVGSRAVAVLGGSAEPQQKDNRMDNVKQERPRQPLNATPGLSKALIGSKRLFAGQSVESFLQEQLADLVGNLRARSARARRQPSPKALVEQVKREWRLNTLTLSKAGIDPLVLPHNSSFCGEIAPLMDENMLAMIHLGYRGSDVWWDLAPPGVELIWLRGSLSYGRLVLRISVPRERTAAIPEMFKEALRLIRAVVDRQVEAVAAFNATVPERAAKLITIPRHEDVLEDVVKKLQRLEY